MRGEPGSGPLCDGHSSPTCRLQLQTWAPGWLRMGAGEGTVQRSQITANSQTPQTISPQSGEASIGQALGVPEGPTYSSQHPGAWGGFLQTPVLLGHSCWITHTSFPQGSTPFTHQHPRLSDRRSRSPSTGWACPRL